MVRSVDGPRSPLFRPVRFAGTSARAALKPSILPRRLAQAFARMPEGDSVCWGIPFDIADVILVRDEAVTVTFEPVRTRWLVFLHTADPDDSLPWECGEAFLAKAGSPPKNIPVPIGRPAARYAFGTLNGACHVADIRHRFEISPMQKNWGESAFAAVGHQKPMLLRSQGQDPVPAQFWGLGQWRALMPESVDQVVSLFSWRNPTPEDPIVSLRIEPQHGTVLVLGMSAGDVEDHPTRWGTRHKAMLRLGDEETFNPSLAHDGTEGGLLGFLAAGSSHVGIDLGQIISVQPRTIFPHDDWIGSPAGAAPDVAPRELLIEYFGHPDAHFHLPGRGAISARAVEQESAVSLTRVADSTHRVRIRTIDGATGAAIAVRLHVHGETGEYLAPTNHDRIPNPGAFVLTGADSVSAGLLAAYVNGVANYRLPLGDVYIEATKGFEVRPVRMVAKVGPETEEIVISLDRVIDWRRLGWVTADTHVHYVTPAAGLIEGEAEGVNVVNLLASQWGESFSNIADFDQGGVHGSREMGGSGEYLLRVGSENRQPVLGHISLLGYDGPLIEPLCTGGPSESAGGDAVEVLISEWAQMCRQQNGLVVLPHHPYPRCEQAAAVVAGLADAVELSFPTDLQHGGLDPYSLVDWYRFLNCGYQIPAVGGTDKMSPQTAVGAARTYVHISPDVPFTYESWKQAIRAGHSFVTLGPLLDFVVDGRIPGQTLTMEQGGGTVDVQWKAESAVSHMLRVELVVNGEILESLEIDSARARGSWKLKLEHSSWIALLVRSKHARSGKTVIAAHSSAVMVRIGDTAILNKADAVSVLAQIEGAIAYLDTVATRPQYERMQQMRLKLTSAHRTLHNRMHKSGLFHTHSPLDHHGDH